MILKEFHRYKTRNNLTVEIYRRLGKTDLWAGCVARQVGVETFFSQSRWNSDGRQSEIASDDPWDVVEDMGPLEIDSETRKINALNYRAS